MLHRAPGLIAAAATLLTVVGGAGAQSPRGPQVVAIRFGAGENVIEAQGITRSSGKDCLILTPKHVVNSMSLDADVFVAPNAQATANIFLKDQLVDLGVLKASSDSLLTCDAWKPDSTLASVFESATVGVIVSREFGGGRTNMPVRLRRISSDSVLVVPESDRDAITRGMSGSLLVVNGLPAGILYSVDALGGGLAYRMDFVARVLSDVFNSESVAGRAIDPRAALAIVDRALDRQDGSQMMQVAALETLLGAGNTFTGTDFSGVLLAGARLTRATIDHSTFTLSDLSDVQAQHADLREAKFTFTTLTRAKLDSAVISASRAHFASAAASSWRGADLSRSNFWASDLRGADFRGANLQGASLTFSDLRGARFDNADLRGAYLIGSVLDSASFAGARFDETDVLGSSVIGVTLSRAQLSSTCRHAVFARGVAELKVRLYGKSASGDDEEIDGQFAQLNSLGDLSLRKCTSPDTSASGFDARAPEGPFYTYGMASFSFSRKLIESAGRRSAVAARVKSHLKLLFTRLRPEFNVRDTATIRAGLDELRRRAARAASFAWQDSLTEISFPALVLANSAWRPDSAAWRSMALLRWYHDVGSVLGRHVGDSIPTSSVFFPPGVPWNELPTTERVSLYRDYLRNGAGVQRQRFTCRAKGWLVPKPMKDSVHSAETLELAMRSGYARNDTLVYAADFRLCGSLGMTDSRDTSQLQSSLYMSGAFGDTPPFSSVEAKWRREVEPDLSRIGIAGNRLVLIGRALYGLDWVMLALPENATSYRVRARPELILTELTWETAWRIDSVTTLTLPLGRKVAIISATPQRVREAREPGAAWLPVLSGSAARSP